MGFVASISETGPTALELVSRAELHARLLGVLELARGVLARLDAGPIIQGEQDDLFVRFEDKVALETALLALIVGRVSDPPAALVRAQLDLIPALERRAHAPRVATLLMRFPHLAAALGLLHFAVTNLGKGDADFDLLFRHALASTEAEAVERLPFRALELAWLRRQCGLPTEELSRSALALSIVSSRRAHPIYLTRSDGYAFTHGLMYATDFGRDALPSQLDPAQISAATDAGIIWTVLAEDLDLLGEYLLCAVFMGRSQSTAVRLGWSVMRSAWDELDVLPAPDFDPQSYVALKGSARRDYALIHTYHTTYVAGILCALLLGRSDKAALDQPPLEVDGALQERLSAAVRSGQRFCNSSTEVRSTTDGLGLSQLARRGGTSTRTLTAIRAAPLNDGERSQVLCELALIGAIRRYDMAALNSTLFAWVKESLALSFTVIEAVRFLVDQQLPSGAIGAQFVGSDQRTTAAKEITSVLTSTLHAVHSRLERARKPQEANVIG